MDGRLDKQQQGKVNSEGRKKKHATVLHLGNAWMTSFPLSEEKKQTESLKAKTG